MININIKHIIAYAVIAVLLANSFTTVTCMNEQVYASEVAELTATPVITDTTPISGSKLVDNTKKVKFDLTQLPTATSNETYSIIYKIYNDAASASADTYKPVEEDKSGYVDDKGIDIDFPDGSNTFVIKARVCKKIVGTDSSITYEYGDIVSYTYTETLPELTTNLGVSWIDESPADSTNKNTAKISNIDTSNKPEWISNYTDICYRWGYKESDGTIVWLYDTDTNTPSNDYDATDVLENKNGTCTLITQGYMSKGSIEVTTPVLEGESITFDNDAPTIASIVLTDNLVLDENGVVASSAWQVGTVEYIVEVEDTIGLDRANYQAYDKTGNPIGGNRNATIDNDGLGAKIIIAIPEDKDGIYIYSISANDKAGNSIHKYIIPKDASPEAGTSDTLAVDTPSLRVDRKAPVFTYGGVTDEAYISCAEDSLEVTAVLQDIDSGIDTSANSIDDLLTATLDGENIEGVTFGTITNGSTDKEYIGDGVEDKLTFSEEGVYNIGLSEVKDVAGNEMEDSSISFTIDNTDPICDIVDGNGHTIVGESNGKICSSAEDITITMKDLHIDKDTSKVTLIQGSSKEVEVTWVEDESEVNQVKGTFSFTGDGDYIVEVTAKDKAGNTVVKKGSIVIDGDLPVNSISISTPHLNGYYKDDVVANIEIDDDVSKVCEAKLKVTKDGVVSYEDITANIDIYSANGQYKTTRTYTEEGDYTMEITSKDMANNSAVAYSISFRIDKTAPELEILGVAEGDRLNADANISFKKLERFDEDTKYTISVARKYLGNLYEESIYDKTTWETTYYPKYQWKGNNYVANQDGEYKITFTAEDPVGNKTTVEKTFTIDKTAPQVGNITYSNSGGLIGLWNNTIYSNNTITVEFDAVDAFSGVDKVYYSYGANGWNSSTYVATHISGNRYGVNVPDNGSADYFNNTISLWAIDAFGNRSASYVVSDNMIYNTGGSEIIITPDRDISGWTSDNIGFTTRVRDTKSGIRSIVYRINGKVYHEEHFTSKVYDYNYSMTVSDSASVNTGYSVEVVVINNTGTESYNYKQVYVDKEAPVARITGVEDGEHISGDKTLAFTVRDAAYDTCRGEIYVEREIDGFRTTVAVSDIYPTSNDDTSYRTFSEEGYYTAYFTVVDGAGNSTVSNTVHFTVDKTAPVLNISGTTEGSINKSDVTLDFSVVESFYDTNTVDITVEKEIDGVTTTRKINGLLNISKTSNISSTFTEDGRYRVTFTSVDRAGNVALQKTITFTVDKTAPKISMSGTTNYLVTSRNVVLSSSIIESFYGTNKITITGTRKDIDGKVHDIKEETFNGDSKNTQRSNTFTEDGIYYIHIQSVDEAGNESEQEIHFTIDKTIPEIIGIDLIDGKYFSTFQLPTDINEILKDISIIKYKILINGIEYDGSPITEDGKYSLYIEAIDEVGNVNSASAEFVVDHTAPKVIVDGIENGEKTYNPGEITIFLADQEDTIRSLTVNGEEQVIDTSERLYTISYNSYGSYDIIVDSIDNTGNTDVTSVHFTYTNSFTKVLLIGGILVLVIFVELFIYVATKGKKTDNRLRKR